MNDAPLSYRLTRIGLGEGLGVEDIAEKHKLDAALVRAHVEAMRRNGELARIYAKAG